MSNKFNLFEKMYGNIYTTLNVKVTYNDAEFTFLRILGSQRENKLRVLTFKFCNREVEKK